MTNKCQVCLDQYDLYDLKDNHLCHKCLIRINEFDEDIGRLKRAILYLKCSATEPIDDSIVHGVDCVKAKHTGRWGHNTKDDTPFSVDSVTYCGRCRYQL